ncbi:MAG: phage/plasmid primase, P4 family [Pirellulaceae bacterium]
MEANTNKLQLDEKDETAATVAVHYARRGWSVIPIPHQSKNPGIKGWQQLRLGEGELPQHFNGHPQNIGVLLGEPSDWLIDIDLDHPRAIELAAEHLPPTDLRFGRASKPESHWIYRVGGPIATKKHRSKSAGMIVELRSTGTQTVFPPSAHESGEAIEFVDPAAEPALVDPEELQEAVKSLADAVKVELGEKPAPRVTKKQQKVARLAAQVDQQPIDIAPAERSKRALQSILRMRVPDHQDGSLRLFAAACRCIEFDLSDNEACSLLRNYIQLQPFPRDWTDEEILKRVSDARNKVTAGSALQPDKDHEGLVSLGSRDPESGRVVLSPKRTLPTAAAFVAENHQHAFGRTLHCHAEMLMEWNGSRYVLLEEGGAKSRAFPWLHEAVRYVQDRETKEMILVPFDANPTSVNAALDTIKAEVHLPATLSSPAWLDGRSGPPPDELLVCKSKLIHLPTGRQLDATPQLFVTNALEFDPDPNAAEPTAWHDFLHQLFDGDLESLDLLQEWFGYSLTADTSQQKMLLMVGPRRGGKGTIARVLRQLIGEGNVAGPTTSSLAGSFGLQPLIGKSLAIVSDARFSGDGIATVVERLLTISGEDAVSIDRKYLSAVTMKLPTRFMFLTNEFPRFSDASGALAGRFVILRLTQSFYGREDTGLTNRLLDELPGILNWAIDGWKRLRQRGHFVMPASCAEAMRELEELSSPVQAFVRDMCVLSEGARVGLDELYRAWTRWCESEGRSKPTTKQVFGRDMKAAFPELTCRRGTYSRFYEGIGLRSDQPC